MADFPISLVGPSDNCRVRIGQEKQGWDRWNIQDIRR